MTRDVLSSELEHLASEIFKNEKPVTYHSLARSLNIHQNNAKKVLSRFYEKNKEKLTASFIITGSNKNGSLIKLSENEMNLDKDVKLFDKINTIHVYCVSNKECNYSNVDIANEELKYSVRRDNLNEYYMNGMIKGPELKVIKKLQYKGTQSASIKKKETGLTPGYTSGKESASKDHDENRSKSRASTISGYVSRKGESKAKQVKRPSTVPAPKRYEYKSRKLESKQPRERVIVSSHGYDNADDEDTETMAPMKAKNTELEKLFEDEFSDEDGNSDNKNVNEPVVVEHKEDIKNEEKENNSSNKVFEEQGLTNENKQKEVENKDDNEQELQEEQEQGGIITKSDTTDGDTYFTSYRKKSASKTEPKRSRSTASSSRPTKVTNNSKKLDGKKTQSSLMSFFQKR